MHDDHFIDDEADAQAWAEAAAGCATFCPYCGEADVTSADDAEYECGACGANYKLIRTDVRGPRSSD